MPDYAAPGFNVEKRDRNHHPIIGVSTSTAAFIGFAPVRRLNRRGVVNESFIR